MRRAMLAAAMLVGWGCGSSSKVAPAPAPAPPPAAPVVFRPAITVREQYYDIDGQSTSELREQIHRLGPKGDGDVPHDALTIWNLEWSYHEAPGTPGTGCGLKDIKVTLDMETTLPRWTPPQTAPASLVQTWRTYLAHVKLHEAGHRQIAEQNARDLMTALTALHGATCPAVWDEASQTAERVVSEGRVRNRAYDTATKHGQTQGVVLGP